MLRTECVSSITLIELLSPILRGTLSVLLYYSLWQRGWGTHQGALQHCVQLS